MRSMLTYNFRIRANSDEICFGKAEKIEPEELKGTFSLPPKYHASLEPFSIIQRPEIPELDKIIEKYL